jgi:hypothetical protein
MDFEDITLMLGIIGLVIQIIAFTCIKNPRRVLLVQSIACLFWITHFILLGLTIIALAASVVFTRNIVSSFIPEKCLKPFLIILMFFNYSLTIYLAQSVFEASPIICTTIGSIACLYRDKRVFFFSISMVGALTWLVIHIYAGSIPSTINASLLAMSIAIGLGRAINDYCLEKQFTRKIILQNFLMDRMLPIFAKTQK